MKNLQISSKLRLPPIAARIACGAALAAGLALTSAAQGERVTMVLELRGGQEVPPNPSPARGCGRVIIDTIANTLSYHISFTGLTTPEAAAHFHGPADPGVNAGVMFALPVGNPKIGTIPITDVDETNFLAGKVYVNIHTGAFPGGEIRGQVNHFAMVMDGIQENPPVALPSQGWGTFNIDTCANELRYHIVVESLGSAEAAAHIHGRALPGTNAGVLHTLPPGAIKTGVWLYPENLEQSILDGMTYVNVHTVANPSGEIRGQIVSTVAPIDGFQETPPVATPAAGCGYIAFDRSNDTMGYYILHHNLLAAEAAAHIHGYSPPGVPSGVVHPLPVGSPKKGTWLYGAANAANVLGGLTYINIHTNAFPGGEIRGQIISPLPECAADTTCDGVVDVSDLLGVINSWGPCPAPCPADINGDGQVDVTDLLAVINGWGPCP